MHHGIKGQKWGIRRYQNEDGTLTPEGRERYGLKVNQDEKIQNANLRKRTKALQKESRKLYNRLGYAQDSIAEDLAIEREYEDKKKWANNKEFKKDVQKAVEKVAKQDDPDWGDEWIEEEFKLLKKYPEAKRLIEGFSPWEHDYKNTKSMFNDQTVDIPIEGEPYYYSWLDNVLNNDFYYEPQDFYEEAWTKVTASKADINNDLAKKYGQDAVDEILKKGYSSLV